MNIATHTVSLSGTGTGPSQAQAADARAHGFVACVHAWTAPSPLAQDLAAAGSALVLDAIRSHVDKHASLLQQDASADQGDQILDMLTTALNLASRELDALGRRRNTRVQATVDAVVVSSGSAYVAHVGDGGVFLLRKGLVHKLTQEHHDPEAAGPGRRAKLSRALGRDVSVTPETVRVQVADGDRLLAVSPWVNAVADDLQIREVSTDPLQDGLTARLLGVVQDRGGAHDLSIALVDVGRIRGAAPSPRGRLATLARIPMFAYCTERELLAVAGITRPVRYRTGSVVFREGDSGTTMFLVLSGQLQVLKGEQGIATLGAGANFGEMAMLDQPGRSATIEVLEDAELLVITREAFFALLKRDPTLAVKVLWNMLLRLSSNLRSTSEKLAQKEAEGQ